MTSARFFAAMVLSSCVLWIGAFITLGLYVCGFPLATGLTTMLAALGLGTAAVVSWFAHIIDDAKPKDHDL